MSDNVTTLVPATLAPVPEVVGQLERMLEMAKRGDLRDIVEDVVIEPTWGRLLRDLIPSGHQALLMTEELERVRAMLAPGPASP